MDYHVFSSKAPTMPKAGKGTEFVNLVLSQATKAMQQPLLPIVLPAVAAHLCETEFQYSDNKYYEMCGQMGKTIGKRGCRIDFVACESTKFTNSVPLPAFGMVGALEEKTL